MFARLQGTDAPFSMQAIGQRVVDGLNGRVGQKRGVTIMHLRDLVLVSQRPSAHRVARGNGHHLHFRDSTGWNQQSVRGNACGAKQTNAHRAISHLILYL
jgi:hypothetical protein